MPVYPLRLHDAPPPEVRGGVVAVGNFDGVHRGHASLIAAARETGRSPVVAATFDPHPLVLLAPEKYQPPLTTVAERARLLHAVGADHVAILQTTPELLALSPQAFFGAILRESLAARGVVEGFNFRFGKDRAGSNDTLRTLCAAAGVEFREVPAFTRDGRPVSSSRVRDALLSGDVAAAAELFARPYRVSGIVGTGARRGRALGFPTANLEGIETIVPAEGVYAVSVTADAGRVFAGAAHIGPNATFGEDARTVEVHLLDFAGDLYGQELAVDFLARLRGTQKFAGVDALVEQMRRDVAEARRICAPFPLREGG
jgi:riboflavin kinase / FMN adenylyltransferase